MKIRQISIKNFRSIKDMTINLDDYSVFVGENGAGKSNVLKALNFFFQEKTDEENFGKVDESDFYQKDDSTPIEVELAFSNLSPQAAEDLKDYVRKNGKGEPILRCGAEATGKGGVKQFGQRWACAEFAPAFNKDLGVVEVKEIYAGFREKYTELKPCNGKDHARELLREFEAGLPDERKGWIKSHDQLYGVQGRDKLMKHLSWVYVPVLKGMQNEDRQDNNNFLSKIIKRVIGEKSPFSVEVDKLQTETSEKYKEIIKDHSSLLNGLQENLQKQLHIWANPSVNLGLSWDEVEGKSVSVGMPKALIKLEEGQFSGEVSKFGHGLQRSMLISLLNELSASSGESQPTLILGFEEPELFQHPPQQRYLAERLLELSKGQNMQTLVTTHSPYFVPSQNIENLKLIRKTNGKSQVHTVDKILLEELISGAGGHVDNLQEKLVGFLKYQRNETFFAPQVVFVEGQEDVAFLETYFSLSGKAEELRKKKTHIISVSGKGELPKAIGVAQLLGIPYFCVFDYDKGESSDKRLNPILCNLLNWTEKNFQEPIISENFCIWPKDIGTTVVAEMGLSDGLGKDPLPIMRNLRQAYDEGNRSRHLEELCEKILNLGDV